MGTAVTQIAKPQRNEKTRTESAPMGFKSVIKKLFGWLQIDGDVFLESKDWPYLWKK